MTRIGIVGGGRAATLHAESAAAHRGFDLVGVGGRPGSATALADAMGVPDLALAELINAADGLVLAVPAAALADVLDHVPPSMPVLLELPTGDLADRPHLAMAAANLLHAPVVKQALRAIADLGTVHHLALRGRAVRRDGSADILNEPFAGAWPVLLAAAGVAVSAVEATIDGAQATVGLELADGRRAAATLEWVGPEQGVGTELEAAGATGVVQCGLWPTPQLETDGRAIAAADDHPLVALGFLEQMRRFEMACRGHSAPWPPLSVGVGIHQLTEAARRSAAAGGERVELH